MIQGIADGVTSNTGILTKAIQAAIAAALKAAKDAADIQSPSKLFANMVGKPIVEGMAYGILQAAPLPAAAMQSVVTTTANSYDQRTITIAPVVSNQMDVYTMLDEIKIALRSEA